YLITMLLGSVCATAKGRSLRLLPWLPVVFFTVHCGAGAGILSEMLSHLFARISGFRGSATARRPQRALLLDQGASMPKILEHPELKRVRQESSGPIVNALTIDVEDYFHVSAFERCVDRSQWDSFEQRIELGTYRILQLLDQANARATFFILGWVAERQPELVRAIHTAGHEIGCHSYWHRLVYNQTPEEFRDDVRRSRDVLET